MMGTMTERLIGPPTRIQWLDGLTRGQLEDLAMVVVLGANEQEATGAFLLHELRGVNQRATEAADSWR
jgi:hypothetical protein